MQGIVGNLADELTSSQRASREEAEQTEASMLQRETNNSFRHSTLHLMTSSSSSWDLMLGLFWVL